MFVRLANTEHFHYVLDKAIHRLEGHCNYWEVYLEDNADNTCCTESDKCEIRNALGKTHAILTSKVPKFRNLIHAHSCGKKIGRCGSIEDLRIHWGTFMIDIADVEEKFSRLTQKRLLEWKSFDDQASGSSRKAKVARAGANKSSTNNKKKCSKTKEA